jgi:hypothetical protein
MNEENEQIGEIILRKVRADGIVMSRVPKRVRDNFLKLAEDEFAGDYGMTLVHLWNTFELWNTFMVNWDFKLNHIIGILDTISSINSSNSLKKIKMMDGKIIEKGGKDEQVE